LSSTTPPRTHIYPPPLHDALPISSTASASPRLSHAGTNDRRPHQRRSHPHSLVRNLARRHVCPHRHGDGVAHHAPACLLPTSDRSEEHTSELQSLRHLVCRLLLEK